MKLIIFDLDNTLIAGDSDYLWGEFLSAHGYVDAESYRLEHERYYQHYLDGELDIDDFLAFQLKPLADNDMQTLLGWRDNYLHEKIVPIILPKARALIREHHAQGHTLLMITATNRFLTELIAEELAIKQLIACEPEVRGGQFTGKVSGVPAFKEGKVIRFEHWLAEQKQSFDETWFYSDSHNDIPLLNRVDHAVAVDPDQTLRQYAEAHDWEIISLRDQATSD